MEYTDEEISQTIKEFAITLGCLFLMGAGIGFCLAIVLISGPLNQHYQAEMNRITNNSNLVCFDVSTLKKTTGNNTQDFIVLNKLTAAEWCNARDAMKVVSPLIYTMNTSALG